MTKRYDEAIEVMPDPAHLGAPLSFSWRGRRYDVDQWLMTWREAGEWWARSAHSNGRGNGRPPAPSDNDRSSNGTSSERARREGPREREYFRVLARPAGAMSTGELDADGFMSRPGAVYDVYRDRVRGEWRLARVWD